MQMLGVGRFFGVPVLFAPSWLIIAALLTIYYGPVVESAVPSISSSTAYLLSLCFAVLLAVCVLAHELGHTGVSLLLGLPVRRVVIFLLGGVSEIERDPERARDEFLIALAGPVVSLILAGISAGGYELVHGASIPSVLFALMFWSNLTVAIFNLLPGLPLDGGRLLRAGVWGLGGTRLRGTQIAAWTGRVVAVVVGVSGLLAERTTLGVSAGLFSVAIAVYLWIGAGQSLRVGVMLERVPAVDLNALLRPGLFVLPEVSVAEALRRAWEGHARGLVVVDTMQRPRAIVDESRIGSVPPDRRPWVPVTEVARPLEPGLVLHLGMSGGDLLAAVRATPAHEYLVVDGQGQPAGILTTADLVAALQGPA